MWRNGLGLLALWGAVACTSSGGGLVTPPSVTPTACTDGETQPCSCSEGGPGRQTCEGGSFGACGCSTPSPPDGGAPLLQHQPDAGKPTPPVACMQACGGALQGHWRFDSACTSDVSFVCATHLTATPSDVSIDLTFATSTVDGAFTGNARTTADITSCPALNGKPQSTGDCDDMATTLSQTSGLTDTACTWQSPVCSCSYTSSWRSTFQSSAFTNPTSSRVRLSAPDGDSDYDYCVSGDTLSLRPVSDPRIKDVTYILRRVVCTPGSADCTGNVPHTCNADGTGYTDGAACADGMEACVAGACHPIVCKPLEHRCNASGNGIEFCVALGTSVLTTACSTSQYCDDTSPATPTCRDTVCNPGLGACNGAVSTSCNANGSAFLPGGDDCSAKSLACSPGAGCLVATSYDAGSDGTPWQAVSDKEVGTLVGNVTSDTRLVEFQSYLSLTAAEHVAFSVYESPALSYGTYTRILFETLAVPAQPGGLVSSGPVNVMMKTGFSYIVTARPDGDFGSAQGYSSPLPFAGAFYDIDFTGPASDTLQTSDMSQFSSGESNYVRLVTGTAPPP